MEIEEVGRALVGSEGAVWIQHKGNRRWIPLEFLEPHKCKEPEPEPEPEPAAWGEGSAEMARAAVRASAAESEAWRGRAEAAATDAAALRATLAAAQAELTESRAATAAAERARADLETGSAKLEGAAAVATERSASMKRLMDEEKAHATTLARQAKRAEERAEATDAQLEDMRVLLAAQQARAVAAVSTPEPLPQDFWSVLSGVRG